MQVSYVILNGSTWGLEVKGVNRERRQIDESSLERFSFIDTRNIPKRLETRLTNFYTSDHEGESDEHLDDDDPNCSGVDIDYEHCMYLSDDIYLQDTINANSNSYDDYATTNTIEHGTILSNEVTMHQNETPQQSTKLSRKELVQKLMKQSTQRAENKFSITSQQTPSFIFDNIINTILSKEFKIVDTMNTPLMKNHRRNSQPGMFTTRLFDVQPEIIIEHTTNMAPTNNIDYLTQVSEGDVLKVDQDEPIGGIINVHLEVTSEGLTESPIIRVCKFYYNLIYIYIPFICK